MSAQAVAGIGAGVAALGGFMGARSQKRRARQAAGQLAEGQKEARGLLTSGVQRGRGEITSGIRGAQDIARGGFQRSGEALTEGFGTMRGMTDPAYEQARYELESGLGRQRGAYRTPEMITTKEELYSRAMGLGGPTMENIERMKAAPREAFGIAGREAARTITPYMQGGDATAQGLAAETTAQEFGRLGAQRAGMERDIELQSALQARAEQEGAMRQLQDLAGAESGIERLGTQQLAGLPLQQLGQELGIESAAMERFAGLPLQEAQALAGLEQQLGIDLSQMSLSEASQLASIVLGGAQSQAGLTMSRRSGWDTLAQIGAGVAGGAASGIGR